MYNTLGSSRLPMIWVQVIDECWAILAQESAARMMQASWKLGRTHGVANLLVAHKPADLRAQADDGTSTAKIADGLLADTATKIVLHQEPSSLEEAAVRFGLNALETKVVGMLRPGRAHWRVGEHTAVVQHWLGPGERVLVDTDAQMRGDSV